MDSATDRDPIDDAASAAIMELDDDTTSPAAATLTPDAPPADQAPEQPAQESPESTPAPASPATPSDGTPPPPDAVPQLTWTPPTGEPATIRVEGRPLTADGSVTTPDGGVYFAPDAWNRFQRNHVGDPRAAGRREAQLRDQLEHATNGKTEKEQRAQALLDQVHTLFSNPERLAKEYENWAVNGPRLLAEAEKQAALNRLKEIEDRDSQRTAQEQEAALIPELQNELGTVMERMLSQPAFAGIPTEQQHQAIRDLWAMHQRFGYHPQGVFVKDRQGIRVNEDFVYENLARLAKPVAKQAQVAKVVAQNKAAVAPTKALAGGPVVRDTRTGQFKPVAKQKPPRDFDEDIDNTKFFED